jgi:hypothetical protein
MSSRDRSKAAVALAAAALVISVANAGGPAIAGALGRDSDTVDGFDAVKASTPTKQRKGTLVATSPKNGRLPNNIIAKAPDSARLEGRPPSFFLSSAAAAGLYETTQHASATYATQAQVASTYETRAHAEATYQSKTEATAAGDRVVVVANPTNALPDDYHSALALPFTTPTTGRLRLEVPVHYAVSCDGTDAGIIWLAVDGTAVATSAQSFVTARSADFQLTGITDAPVAAGSHEVEVRVGCIGGTWQGASYQATMYAFVTVLGAGTVVTP